MNKLKELETLVNNTTDKNLIISKIKEIFKEQIEHNTAYDHLILTEEQWNSIDDDFDLDIFKGMLVSVERKGTLNFIHYFNIENMKSIKEKGLLVNYSKKDSDYMPDMGYGIYVIKGDTPYDMDDELAETLYNRYEEDVEVGYVIGTYTGKYLECVYDYTHSSYYLLKEDVTLGMINIINTEYLSYLAKDYFNYLNEDYF